MKRLNYGEDIWAGAYQVIITYLHTSPTQGSTNLELLLSKAIAMNFSVFVATEDHPSEL